MRKLLGIAIVLVCGVLRAEDVQLAWNPNTEPTLAGYILHRGTEPRRYTTSTDVGNTTAFKVAGLERGTHYFAVTAYDRIRMESGYSNEVRVAIDPPGLPYPSPVIRTVGGAVTISWETPQASAVRINYGPTTGYGSSITSGAIYTLKHTIGITGLSPATTYHYKIISQDEAGNLTISGDMVFTTAATAAPPAAAAFYYPRLVGTSDNRLYTGVAFVNLDASPALLTFRLWAHPETASSGIRILNPGEQFAVVDAEVLDGSATTQDSAGWVEVTSTAPKVFGFFMNFDQSLSSIDGAVVLSSPLSRQLFPSIVAEGSLRLALANPGAGAAAVALDFVSTTGSILNSLALNIGPAAGVEAASPGTSPYVRATSDKPILGLELLDRPGKWKAFLPAQDAGSGAAVVWGAQYVYGGPWHSHITLINTGPSGDSLTLRWIGDDGTQIGRTQSLAIAANGAAVISDPRDFGVSGDTVRQGYIEVRSGGARILGSVTIHDESAGRFATALPLISESSAVLLVPHVASDGTYFTGLAVVNPSESDTRITVELWGADGKLKTTVSDVLAARNRRARLVTELFPELSSQSVLSGYLRVVADRPVVAFALFGTHDLSMFSAVPAQAVR